MRYDEKMYLSGLENFSQGIEDHSTMVLEIDVVQHGRRTDQHGSWISNIFPYSLCIGVPRSLSHTDIPRYIIDSLTI